MNASGRNGDNPGGDAGLADQQARPSTPGPRGAAGPIARATAAEIRTEPAGGNGDRAGQMAHGGGQPVSGRRGTHRRQWCGCRPTPQIGTPVTTVATIQIRSCALGHQLLCDRGRPDAAIQRSITRWNKHGGAEENRVAVVLGRSARLPAASVARGDGRKVVGVMHLAGTATNQTSQGPERLTAKQGVEFAEERHR